MQPGTSLPPGELVICRDGNPPKTEMAGPTCHIVITCPLVTGEMNVSLMGCSPWKNWELQAIDLFVATP